MKHAPRAIGEITRCCWKACLAWAFNPILKREVQSHIITAFPYPRVPGFSFPAFYRGLSERGFLIYPGKLTQVDTFRIGTIGRLFPERLGATGPGNWKNPAANWRGARLPSCQVHCPLNATMHCHFPG